MSSFDAHSVLGLPYNASKAEACLQTDSAHNLVDRDKRTPWSACSPIAGVTISDLSRVAQVKQAYRKLCLLHHPDLCSPDKRAEAEKTFKLITEAYSKLAAGALHRKRAASAVCSNVLPAYRRVIGPPDRSPRRGR